MSSYEKKYPDWEQKVRDAAANCASGAQAAAFLGIKYDTYKKYAQKYGCFVTNQSGKGTTRKGLRIPTNDILTGKVTHYSSAKLRVRLIEEGIFEEKCNHCGLTEWMNNKIPLELEHKDGNHNNNLLENLELLCPNCHALTPTHSGKNRMKNL